MTYNRFFLEMGIGAAFCIIYALECLVDIRLKDTDSLKICEMNASTSRAMEEPYLLRARYHTGLHGSHWEKGRWSRPSHGLDLHNPVALSECELIIFGRIVTVHGAISTPDLSIKEHSRSNALRLRLWLLLCGRSRVLRQVAAVRRNCLR